MLKNKIKGLFFGQAIGDALGLGTEFLNKKQISEIYPNGISHYSQIVQDHHRSRWKIADWTDDTDQFLCILDSILQTGEVSATAFAEELYKWFKDLPVGIGNTVHSVVSTPQFKLYPHKAAELFWNMRKRNVASNGAIMRTSILGAWDFKDPNKVKQNTEIIAKTTHFDPRCVGSCVIITSIVSTWLHQNRLLTFDEICALADEYDERIKPFVQLAFNGPIESMELDEPESMGYTLKALAAGLWAYFHATDFKQGILKVVNEGGDADTNAAVAGSLLGVKFGFDAIPKEWVNDLLYKNELEQKTELFWARLALSEQ